MFRIYVFIISFATIFSSVFSDDIPVMLWNIEGDALTMKPVSALGHSDHIFYENLKIALHQDNNKVLVFAVNKLSAEDFHESDEPIKNDTIRSIENFLDSQPHMLLSSVKDPLNYIHKAAHCGVQEIVVDNKIDDIVMKAVYKAIKKSCVIILHVSEDGIVTLGDQTQNVLMPSSDASIKNMIGVFTGVKSSWGAEGSDHHMFRNLLQSEVSESDNNFLNYTGCMIMYAENATIKFGKENETSLAFPPSTEGSECGNRSSILQLAFKTSGDLSSVTLRLNFTRKFGSWVTYGSVSMEGEKALPGEIELNSEFVTAARGFSYSCGKLVLSGKNVSLGLKIVMHRFQVQPFEVKGAFSDSFDCVPFFTVPIWMGVFVSIIFIVILNIGVYALFSVNTMDRFDDPKGKTISVTAAVD